MVLTSYFKLGLCLLVIYPFSVTYFWEKHTHVFSNYLCPIQSKPEILKLIRIENKKRFVCKILEKTHLLLKKKTHKKKMKKLENLLKKSNLKNNG